MVRLVEDLTTASVLHRKQSKSGLESEASATKLKSMNVAQFETFTSEHLQVKKKQKRYVQFVTHANF